MKTDCIQLILSCIKVLEIVFAILSAYFWYKSTRITLPEKFSIHVVRPTTGLGHPMGQPMGGEFVGMAYSNDLLQLAEGLKNQGKWNTQAACYTGIYVLLQITEIFLKLF